MKSAVKYPFLQVGVTGGIGSGKSTVCKMFAGLGRVVISADDVARRIGDEDPEVRYAIESEFGLDSYLPGGSLNRKKIASIVFADQAKRAALDAIIHPRVFREIERQLDALPSHQSSPYVLIEAALIYEAGMDQSLDYIIVVTADEEARVNRVSQRDHVPADEVLRRVAAQLPAEAKEKKADFVIHNNSTESELRSTVQFLDTLLSHFTSRNPS